MHLNTRTTAMNRMLAVLLAKLPDSNEETRPLIEDLLKELQELRVTEMEQIMRSHFAGMLDMMHIASRPDSMDKMLEWGKRTMNGNNLPVESVKYYHLQYSPVLN